VARYLQLQGLKVRLGGLVVAHHQTSLAALLEEYWKAEVQPLAAEVAVAVGLKMCPADTCYESGHPIRAKLHQSYPAIRRQHQRRRRRDGYYFLFQYSD